jgi:ADP-heptose:LPS heptosyltransferase
MMTYINGKNNILIIKPGAIGDLLQLTPVIRELAAHFTHARISIVVGNRTTASLFQFNPHIAEVLTYDRREGRPSSSLLDLWSHIRRSKFGIVMNFQRSNLKTWFLATAAFPCRVLVYHKSHDRAVHVVDNYLATAAPLGISSHDRSLELFTGEDDDRFADTVFSVNGLSGKIVVALNPGASHPVNRWGVDKFAALADALGERFSAKVIIIGGKEDEDLANKISSAASSTPLVLSGKTTLLQLGAVLRKCDLLVSGDTGPLHLATAVGTRVAALFGAADPARTGPVGTGHRIIQAKGVSCMPCRSRACVRNDSLDCMEKLSVQQVVDSIAEMLSA